MTQSKRLNEDFINVLGEMHDLMIRKGESFRARAYKTAEEAIINYPDSITDPKKQLKSFWYWSEKSQRIGCSRN
jgi:DNA polymerase/3'-5' exonuclease PolX